MSFIKFITATNNFIGSENTRIVSIFLKAKLISGEVRVKEPLKCERFDWFNWDSLPHPVFLPLKVLKDRGYNPQYR